MSTKDFEKIKNRFLRTFLLDSQCVINGDLHTIDSEKVKRKYGKKHVVFSL